MHNHWKSFAVIGLIILVFPVLITFIVNKVNVDKESGVQTSGKTIVVNCGSYVAEMDMENFIPCVLMAQMPIESPKEALKAQAVVIRTYILKKMGKDNTISNDELGLPYISYVKLEDMWFRNYRMEHPKSVRGMLGNLTGLGKSRIFKTNMDYLNMIMEKTRMKVLKNGGELILPLYHGISNGTTRSGSEVLGEEYNYLKSVKCNSDMEEENFLGVQYVTAEQLKEKLKKSGIVVYKENKELFSTEDMDLQELMKIIDYSDKDKTSYVKVVKIADTKIAAEDFAKALKLRSTSMEISEYEDGIRITTKGEGHGFGMSLSYAKQLAKDGMEWDKILKTFYDVTISDY